MPQTRAMLSILDMHLPSVCTVWGCRPPPATSIPCCCVPGRPQRSNQCVMCPDYNQLTMGHLQRSPEEKKRGSSITLHGVITGWDSTVLVRFCGEWGLKINQLTIQPVLLALQEALSTTDHWQPLTIQIMHLCPHVPITAYHAFVLVKYHNKVFTINYSIILTTWQNENENADKAKRYIE